MESSLSIRKISKVLSDKYKSLPVTHPNLMKNIVQKTPRNTAIQIRERFANATGVNVSVSTIRIATF